MFNKFSNLDIDSARSRGRYTVQADFGWINGVVLWVANAYGGVLDAPECSNISAGTVSSENSSNGSKSDAATSIVSVAISVVLATVVSGVIFW